MKIIFWIFVLFLIGCMRMGDSDKTYYWPEPVIYYVPQPSSIPYQQEVISEEPADESFKKKERKETPVTVMEKTMSIELVNGKKEEMVEITKTEHDKSNINIKPYEKDGEWIYPNSVTGQPMSTSHKLKIK